MIKKTVYAVLGVLLAFFAGGFLLPAEVTVERSLAIQRPVTTLYTVLNRPATYSKWLFADPDLALRTAGPDSGVGASVEWSGDPRQWGTGSVEITGTRPGAGISSRVVIEGQGTARSEIRIGRIAGGARLTWIVHSDPGAGRGVFGSRVARYFGPVFARWAGMAMERALGDFRDYAGRLPAADFSGLEVERVEAQPHDILTVRDVSGEPAATGGASGLASAFGEISSFMAVNGIELAAQPMTLSYTGKGGFTRLDAAIPVLRADVPASGSVSWGRSPAGPAIRAVHRGSYEDLARTRSKLRAWMAAHGYRRGGVSWDHYLSDPAVTPPAERVTHLYVILAD